MRNPTSRPPQVTTIIPTYKRPEKLRKAIESALSQTYPHLQIFIYDNNSGDSTAAVAAEFIRKDSRIHYHCHPQNIGAEENMQFALREVKTPFFSFLADDDLLLPEFYETALKRLEKYPDAGCFIGATVEIDQTGEMIGVPLSRWQDKEYFLPPEGLLEMIGKYSNWTGALFRTNAAEQIGFLDTSMKAIDVDLLFRMAARYPVTISKKPCAIFIHHPSSYSNTHILELYWPGWLKLAAKLREEKAFLPETKLQVEQMLKIDLQHGLCMAVAKGIEQKNFQGAHTAAKLVYQQSGSKWKKFYLTLALSLCQKLPPIQKGLSAFFALRRFWKRRIKGFHLQREYGKIMLKVRGDRC